MKEDGNLINPAQRLQDAPRCKAKAKRTGQLCRCPAVKGREVCRVHGARGGAPKGPANGNWKHGGRSNQVAMISRLTALLLRQAKALD